MDLKGANLTLEEECSTQDESIQAIIRDHIAARCEVFKGLLEVRAKGWANPNGDRHFKQQREHADKAKGTKDEQYFFKMMIRIGSEMQASTGALHISSNRPRIMDLCLAPGGYTASAMRFNQNATVFGVTLPKALGGHPALLKRRDEIRITFTDITMEAAELGALDLPEDHPDLALFKRHRLLPEEDNFDLIFCDGQVLRTHEKHRHTDREPHEATRLISAQLVISMQHIRPGGTMIILLHNCDEWKTLQLLQIFDRFSRIQLFKPNPEHASRGSFYLIAQDVSPDHSHALAAKDSWLQAWKDATFSREHQAQPSEQEVLDVLHAFGERLIELAEPIWAIQKQGIEKAKWFKKGTNGNKAADDAASTVEAEQGLQKGAQPNSETV